MTCIVKDSIEYFIRPHPAYRLPNPYPFKLFNMDKIIHIPQPKPDIGKIMRVKAETVINETKTIKSIEAISEDGNISTGKKLIVEGSLVQIIEYAEDSPLQSVQTMKLSVPFSTYITVPKSIKTGILPQVTGFIQDITFEISDGRTLFESAIILLTLDY